MCHERFVSNDYSNIYKKNFKLINRPIDIKIYANFSTLKLFLPLKLSPMLWTAEVENWLKELFSKQNLLPEETYVPSLVELA